MKSEVINQIFGRLQHPKHEVRYLENIFFRLYKSFFPYKGVHVTKVMKANIIAFIKTKILRPVLSVTNTPFRFFLVLHALKLIFVTLFFRFPIFGVFRENHVSDENFQRN